MRIQFALALWFGTCALFAQDQEKIVEGTVGAWEKTDGRAGSTSKIKGPTFLRVADEKAWQDIWSKHTGKPEKEEKAPPIDFSKNVVIGAFFEGGWCHMEVKVEQTKKEVHIIYEGGTDECNCPQAPMYSIVVLTKTDKPIVLKKREIDGCGSGAVLSETEIKRFEPK